MVDRYSRDRVECESPFAGLASIRRQQVHVERIYKQASRWPTGPAGVAKRYALLIVELPAQPHDAVGTTFAEMVQALRRADAAALFDDFLPDLLQVAELGVRRISVLMRW